MSITSGDIIRYFSTVASEDPVYVALLPSLTLSVLKIICILSDRPATYGVARNFIEVIHLMFNLTL